MIFEKGKFSFTVNRIGGLSIRYRKFTLEIGFFDCDEYEGLSLFSFKLFNLCKYIGIFQIFSLCIVKFHFDVNINYKKDI